MKTTTNGARVSIPKYFFGYKAHLVAETDHNIITGFHTTPGNAADIDGGDVLLYRILTNDERQRIGVLAADNGYGCPVWINILEKHSGIMTAFALPETMTKRGEHQDKWTAYAKDEGRTAFRKDRYIIEQVNGDLKQNHGLRRCRYLGLSKYALQLAMASMAHNLKIFMRIMTGARFKPV